MRTIYRLRFFCLVVLSIALWGCASSPADLLTPQGALRMGLYKGTPTSVLDFDGPGQARARALTGGVTAGRAVRSSGALAEKKWCSDSDQQSET